MVVGGRLYPSDRGVEQTNKYIYYDGSAGAGGDFMRTNAKGWSTGSYDFAEMFPSDQKLTAGDIVSFSGTGEQVKRANDSADERFAGIVSTRPGFLAGENTAGMYPIALAGRVPTKVSAENGAIVVGDPLTASSTAGVAMKATVSGQIVGYALEAYTGNESDNLVMTYVSVGYWGGGSVSATPGTENSASGFGSYGTSNFVALNMAGNIFMATNQILSIGRLEGAGGFWSIESDGTIKTESVVKTVIDSYQNTKVETVAVTSPEVIITLSGTAKLTDGRAEVRFEEVIPEYNDVISAIASIRVVVTPSGPASLYVSEKDQNHFVVQRFNGTADVEFDWMVIGYRKGFEPQLNQDADLDQQPDVEAVIIDVPETIVEEESVVEEDAVEVSPVEEVVVQEVIEEVVVPLVEEESVVEDVVDVLADEIPQDVVEPDVTVEPDVPVSPDVSL